MRLIFRLAATVASATLVVSLLAPPAAADSSVFIVTGNLQTDDTWYSFSPFCPRLGLLCDPSDYWNLGATAIGVPLSGWINGGGPSVAWCEAGTGNGAVDVLGHAMGATWAQVGGTFALAAQAPGQSAVLTMQIRPLPTGGGVPCLTEPARSWLAVGAGALNHASIE